MARTVGCSGAARPIELTAMQAANTADSSRPRGRAAVTDPSPFIPTQGQITAAKDVVTQKWSAAVS